MLRVIAKTTSLTSVARPMSSSVVPSFSSSFSSSTSPEDVGPPPEDSAEITGWIEKAIKSDKVVLFMKGTPMQPQCGFSMATTRALMNTGARFSAHNVLDSDTLRNGIKVYSSWPTIPQLYIDGEFVGGADIVTQMDNSGELFMALKKAGALEQ